MGASDGTTSTWSSGAEEAGGVGQPDTAEDLPDYVKLLQLAALLLERAGDARVLSSDR